MSRILFVPRAPGAWVGLSLWALVLSAWGGPTFTNAVNRGTISIPELSEASGLVASRNNPDVLWTHNDSGDTARLFALDTQGRKLGIYTLPGITATDIEDIAVGPGPVTNVSYLYVADIGDNAAIRSNIRVHQISEPAVYLSQFTQPKTNPMKGVRTITLTYPDGKHNAEGLFIDPWTGDLFIATKEANLTRLFTAPKAQLDTNNSFVLTLVRSNVFDLVTAADISPTGGEIVLRQEQFARLWIRTNGQSISNAMAAAFFPVPVLGDINGEPQGEAIAFDYVAHGYYTVSEGNPQPLSYFERISDDGPTAPRPLLAPGSSWKYLDDGSDQGTNWQNPDFDDSAWSNGLAQFGYGDGDEKTVISYGGNPNNKYTTTYFRKTFAVEHAECITNLTLKMVVDDGGGVYLNGVRVVSEGLAPGEAYNVFGTRKPVALQATWHQYDIDPTLLWPGTNTLAVEIHQASLTSSNISFDLQLAALDARCMAGIELVDQRPQVVLFGPTNATAVIQAADLLTNWSDIGSVVLTNGYGRYDDVEATNYNQRFYRTVP